MKLSFANFTVETTIIPYTTPPPPLESDPPINRHHKRLMQTRAIIQNQTDHAAAQLSQAVARSAWLKARMVERGLSW